VPACGDSHRACEHPCPYISGRPVARLQGHRLGPSYL
jgi:hypothetical protein